LVTRFVNEVLVAGDYDRLAELVEESFRNRAGKRLIAELDARQQ